MKPVITTVVLGGAILALGLCFACAGAAKLALSVGLPLEAWGVSRRWTPLVRRLLPLSELFLAGLIMSPVTARLGAALAIGVLGLFSAVIQRQPRRGQALPCRCFGRNTGRPADRRTILRNLVLATVAVVIVLLGPPQLRPGVNLMLAALVIFAAQGWVIYLLQRELSERASSWFNSGAMVELSTLAGTRLRLADLLRGEIQALLVVFVDPQCGPCRRLLPDLVAWESAVPTGGRLLVVSEDGAATAEMAERFGLKGLVLQDHFAVAKHYGVRGTPAAVILRPGNAEPEVALGAPRVREAAIGLGFPSVTGATEELGREINAAAR